MADNSIDRAAFKRMGDNKEGCTIAGCTARPVISIGITASELLESARGSMLARKTYRYCAQHGEAKFASGLKVLSS